MRFLERMTPIFRWTLLGFIAGSFHAAWGFISTSSIFAWLILWDLLKENMDYKLFSCPNVITSASSNFWISLKDIDRESILGISIFTQKGRALRLISCCSRRCTNFAKLLAFSPGARISPSCWPSLCFQGS